MGVICIVIKKSLIGEKLSERNAPLVYVILITLPASWASILSTL